MKKKIVYSDAPPEVEKAMAKAVSVKDFLPRPEDLVFKEKTRKISKGRNQKVKVKHKSKNL